MSDNIPYDSNNAYCEYECDGVSDNIPYDNDNAYREYECDDDVLQSLPKAKGILIVLLQRRLRCQTQTDA